VSHPPKSQLCPGLLLVVALLAGCGSSSSSNNGIATLPPAQIVMAAQSAADRAATAHVFGTVSSAGTSASLDMELVDGKGAEGRVVQDGLDLQLIRVGRFVYIKGNPAFYQRIGGETAARLLQGRWLKARATGGFSSLASLTNLDDLVDTALTSHGTLVRNGTTTVDGQRVVAVDDLARGGTLYVATVGSPYPVEVLKHVGSVGRIVFDKWNQPVSLVAPTNAININQLRRPRKRAP